MSYMNTAKLMENQAVWRMIFVASYKQNAGPDRPGQLFDQIAVSDFLLILDNVVTKEFAQHVSYY
jgi:hypothetical protein